MFLQEEQRSEEYMDLFEEVQLGLRSTLESFIDISKKLDITLYKLTFINTGCHRTVTFEDLQKLDGYLSDNLRNDPLEATDKAPDIASEKRLYDFRGQRNDKATINMKLKMMNIIEKEIGDKFKNMNHICLHAGVNSGYGAAILRKQTARLSLTTLNKIYKSLKGKDYLPLLVLDAKTPKPN